MKKFLKSICTVLVMALVFTMVPTLTAVMDSNNSDIEAYAATKTYEAYNVATYTSGRAKVAGKYFWVKGQKFYCSSTKKGKGNVLFSWKDKAYHDIEFLTNGTKVYFTFYNYDLEKQYLYSVSTNGKNRKKLKTFSSHFDLISVWKSKVYINQGEKLLTYEPSTKKTKTIVSDFGMAVTSVDNGRMLLGTSYDTDPLSFYICDTGEKGKTKECVSNWSLHDYGYPLYYHGKKENGVYGVFSQTSGKDDHREIAEVPENWELVEFKLSEGKAYFTECIETETSIETIDYTVDLKTGEKKEINRVKKIYEDDYFDDYGDDYDNWEYNGH